MKYNLFLFFTTLAFCVVSIYEVQCTHPPSTDMDTKKQPAEADDVSSEDGSVDEEDDLDKDDEEDDDTVEYTIQSQEVSTGRKRIVQALQFCLQKGDITPVELINCASDVLHGGNLNPPTQFEKCVGEFITSTVGACTQKLAEMKGKEVDYTEVFTCLAEAIPTLIMCVRTSDSIPLKI
ncbi:uncharacterized protein BBOV_IV008622 [Babesia bovis T2Bo]|uniref:uncharacterized protein n=1 Tax=Babesia bovis T2Bo TaxID=484906 RepID=UPI001DC80E92|nr:uncharacterized protein BBOV_IV008622 [Babesia bovis T2Bo]KAG6439932.1 hypothetical protein BBOV_IV008622 [Babesia bovis T2Bo]